MSYNVDRSAFLPVNKPRMGYYHTSNPENGINIKRHFCKFCGRRIYEKFLRLYEDGPYDVYVCRDRQACFKAQARRDSLNSKK